MLDFPSKKLSHTNRRFSRRDFLRAGITTASLSLAKLQEISAHSNSGNVNCILLFLVGGPSQLDTWDPKPNAPSQIRGPFRPIRTNVPGIEICEHFPLMARMANRYAIVRSVHHNEPAIHEVGQQLMQTGRSFRPGMEYPHYGAVMSYLRSARNDGVPSFVVLPRPLGEMGARLTHGQGPGFLGRNYEPTFASVPDTSPVKAPSSAALAAFDVDRERTSLRDRYGRNTFGQSCLLARRLVERGVSVVTVNMFDSVFNQVTWDCHAAGGSLPSTLDDYRDTCCPMFDRAYTALLEDLHQRGLLSTTLVVVMGEFGRTPWLNSCGGRDHWTGAWSILFAGAGIRGGQVVGSTDKLGAEPRDRPVSPAEVAASLYAALGLDLGTRLPTADGRVISLCVAEPIRELFC